MCECIEPLKATRLPVHLYRLTAAVCTERCLIRFQKLSNSFIRKYTVNAFKTHYISIICKVILRNLENKISNNVIKVKGFVFSFIFIIIITFLYSNVRLLY